MSGDKWLAKMPNDAKLIHTTHTIYNKIQFDQIDRSANKVVGQCQMINMRPECTVCECECASVDVALIKQR